MNTLAAKLITSITGGMDTSYEQMKTHGECQRRLGNTKKNKTKTKRRPERKSEIKTEQQVRKNVTH
jgi:hypothetical protein